jgi:putative transposase
MMADLSHQPAQPSSALTVARRCELVALPRRTYDRLVGRTPPKDTHFRLRDQLQRLALEWPSYGYRRMTPELARRGVMAHHKLVLRLMRTAHLLCWRKRRVVRTTDASHPWPGYPHLAPQLVLTGLTQLWGAAMPSSQRAHELVSLAVSLDAFSRRGIGWALERHLQSPLALAALQMAITTRGVQPGLVQHSDRGVQYASQASIERLTQQSLRISMSRRGTA